MSRHDGVSCDSCLKSNFRGKRYKCLICYDYDLCATCFEAGATTTRHTTDHPVQCIITRTDYEIYYGGEAVTAEQPQSFTCPYCSKMGFTEVILQEHVTSEHADASTEVVCPICASLPGGDPNHVTDDFAAHLTLEHRAPREFDEPTGIRHVRRIPHPGRGVSGARTRRATNMHFSSGGSSLTGIPSTTRDAMDPIAELLSQLSSVRSRAAAAQSVSSQLQQLEQQLQSTRQQLERLPRRQAEAVKSAGGQAAVPTATDQTGVTGSAGTNNNSSSNSLFLLSRCTEAVIEESSVELEQERTGRNLFVQELLLSTLTEQLNVTDTHIEHVDKLPEKSSSSPTVPVSEEKHKSDGVSDASSTGSGSTGVESNAGAVKSSSECASPSGAGALSKTVAAAAVKPQDKAGTKQKVTTTSISVQNGRGASGGGSRAAGRQQQQLQSSSVQFHGDRHSQALHSMRQGTVELTNNLSVNVAIGGGGGGAGFESDNSQQPLPGRPGSGGRDRDSRLNPPAAKRNMVKHLPATKTSDREPPPH